MENDHTKLTLLAEHAKLLFSHSFLSLITSSWQTPTVIRSESATSAMQWRSRLMRLNTANMAHRNLLHQKLSIRPLCQRQQTSGRVSLQFTTKIFVCFVLNNRLFLLFLFICLGQLELLHICGEKP